MGSLPQLINDLALILMAAGLVTILFKRLGQPLVLGYIVAGFICGPHLSLIPTVSSTESIQTWADIGVVFLMFSMGLEFSFKKLFKMGLSPVVAALIAVGGMCLLGFSVGHAFGWGRIDNLFLGGMLSMASTTIVYKALTDLGLLQQRFASGLMSVLIVEDLLSILLLVVLSTFGLRGTVSGVTLVDSLVRLVFYLALLLVVGIFFIPTFLRRGRKLMSSETLLIVSVGLCFAMVVLAVKLGYSSVFGAFMMGSILAETVEADAINRLVSPLKDLFGAIFFVSVGMLVDPAVLAHYWLPIVVLVFTVIVGEAIFGTLGFFVTGSPIGMAMQSGFAMTQIGEFAFIIASLGESLGVTSSFLYPIVVAVSVITTFLTPYMMRAAVPASRALLAAVPAPVAALLNKEAPAANGKSNEQKRCASRPLGAFVRQVAPVVGVYAILSVAATAICLNFALPVLRHLLSHWPGNATCGVLTLAVLAPFLRALVMRHAHSREAKALLKHGAAGRFEVVVIGCLRYLLAVFFTYYVINYLSPLASWIHVLEAAALVALMVASGRVKRVSIRLEQTFLRNLGARRLQAEVSGKVRPLYAARLLSRDIHMADMTLPPGSALAGQTLGALSLRSRYGIMVASILRGGMRINIPGAQTAIYPGDQLQVIGSDEALARFARHVDTALLQNPAGTSPEDRQMQLRCLVVERNSPFCGLTVSQSGLRERWHLMIVGFEQGRDELGLPEASRQIEAGDAIWLVGERADLNRLLGPTRGVMN